MNEDEWIRAGRSVAPGRERQIPPRIVRRPLNDTNTDIRDVVSVELVGDERLSPADRLGWEIPYGEDRRLSALSIRNATI